MKFSLVSLVVLVTLCSINFSCSNDEEVQPLGKYENGVLISNEGNFSDVDGSVGFYDDQTSESSRQIFENENSRPFGGLLQSIGLQGENAYLIDNFGSKVEVVNANSFESVHTILEGLSLPRYFASEGSIGFISNWGPYNDDFTASPNSFLAVLDTEQNMLGERIDVPSRPEGLAIVNGKLFVASQATNAVTVVNVDSKTISGTIEVGYGPSHFVQDKNGMLWVSCIDGILASIDPASNEVLKQVEVANPSGKLAIDGNGEIIFLLTSAWAPDFSYTENAIIKLNISSPETQTTVFTSRNLYGLGMDPETDIIYVANSNAFQGNGTIIRIDTNGNEIDNFPAGRGPNGFTFK